MIFLSYQELQRTKLFEKDIIYKIKSLNYLENSHNNYEIKIDFEKINKYLNLDAPINRNNINEFQIKLLLCIPGLIYNYYNTIGFRKNSSISRIVNNIAIDDFCKFKYT